MKKTIFLLLLCFPGINAFAQKGSWGEFPMVPLKSFSARAAESGKIKNTPEHAQALKVYERLCEARGDYRYPVPEFYLTPKELVAEIAYDAIPTIYLGITAYQVCQSFGDQADAAMAFLLGHELTHYYEKHAWRKSFASNHQDLGISQQLDELFQEMVKDAGQGKMRNKLLRFDTLTRQFNDVAMETQCDYLGGFLAYSAGYGAFTQGDSLIRRLYRAFKLDPDLPGYVSLSEREKLSNKSARKLQDLVEVFEMANWLTTVGLYEEAYRYYRQVLSEYQSREIFNNVGATAMLQALKLFSTDELIYRYPVQLDLEMANSRGDDVETLRKKLLEQALLHFDAAISLDPKYAPAYVNKACALALLGDPVRATYYADVEARQAAVGKYAANLPMVEVILGILEAKSGPDGAQKAKVRFEVAMKTDKTGLAAYNLAVLTKQPLPEDVPANTGFFEDETIDGQNPFSIMFPEVDKSMQIDNVLNFTQNTGMTEHSRLYINSKNGKTSVLFQATKPDYAGETARGIKKGSTQQMVIQQYGKPQQVVYTPTGQLFRYAEVIFVMKEDKVDRWVLYAIK